MSHHYTHAQLNELKRKLEESLSRTEQENPEARPLPPMAEDEAREMMLTFIRTAAERTLADAETFLFGQLIAAYRMAVEARMLGRKGRFYVVSESDIEKAKMEQFQR